MDILESLNKLVGSKEFSSWKKENVKSFLSHAFVMKDDHKQGDWEFGFSDEKNSVTVFEVKDTIVKRDPEAAFKKDNSKIMPLDEKKIKTKIDEALQIVDDIVKDKYANQKPMKILIVVQNLPIGQCWNISYVLHSFKILNVKIDTQDRRVLEEKIVSLIQEGA